MQNKTFHPTRWTLVFLLLSSMMILMGGAAVAPALPAISAAFPDASEAAISLIITLPALAIVFSGFFIGAAVDKFGKVRILAISLAVFTFAGVSGFFLTSLPAILVGRIILG
ncbi:MAG: MFS transporter, partial [Methanocorpusculum sp.]|nr:MFS transporter [Methanocorpusculum sp.]